MPEGTLSYKTVLVETDPASKLDTQAAIQQLVRAAVAGTNATLNDITVDGSPSISLWVNGDPCDAYAYMHYGDVHGVEGISLCVYGRHDEKFFVVFRLGRTTREWLIDQAAYYFDGFAEDEEPYPQLFSGPYLDYDAVTHDDELDNVISPFGYSPRVRGGL